MLWRCEAVKPCSDKSLTRPSRVVRSGSAGLPGLFPVLFATNDPGRGDGGTSMGMAGATRKSWGSAALAYATESMRLTTR